jgi:hypothetical protein
MCRAGFPIVKGPKKVEQDPTQDSEKNRILIYCRIGPDMDIGPKVEQDPT